MTIYSIKEDGKNGSVEVFDDRIVRTRKRTLGKDDLQTFPIASISAVSHDRKMIGSDLVRIQFGSISYEWKVGNAEALVAEIHSKMFKG